MIQLTEVCKASNTASSIYELILVQFSVVLEWGCAFFPIAILIWNAASHSTLLSNYDFSHRHATLMLHLDWLFKRVPRISDQCAWTQRQCLTSGTSICIEHVIAVKNWLLKVIHAYCIISQDQHFPLGLRIVGRHKQKWKLLPHAPTWWLWSH